MTSNNQEKKENRDGDGRGGGGGRRKGKERGSSHDFPGRLRHQGPVSWGRRPSSDDSFHSPTVIPPSALDKPSIMKRYHHR